MEVREGTVARATGARSGVVYDASFERDVSIDDLFARVLESTRDGPDTFKAHYHPKYHFIERLSLDHDDDAEDDGYSLTVTCFSEDPSGCAVPTLTPDECTARGGEVRAAPEGFFELVCGVDAASPLAQVEPGVTICCAD